MEVRFMFKNFQALNSALKNLGQRSRKTQIDTMADQADIINGIANSIMNDYARTYSQIQVMKYNEDGDPVDITPESNNSVAQGVLDSKKEKVKTALAVANFNAISAGTITRPGTLCLYTLGIYVNFESIGSFAPEGYQLVTGCLLNLRTTRAITVNIYKTVGTESLVETFTSTFGLQGIATDANGNLCTVVLFRSNDAGNPVRLIFLLNRTTNTMVVYYYTDDTWNRQESTTFTSLPAESDIYTYCMNLFNNYMFRMRMELQNFEAVNVALNQTSGVQSMTYSTSGENLEAIAPGITDVANAILNL
jgi:hypothetical protein